MDMSVLAACMIVYSVPLAALEAIHAVEGGRVGTISKNTNGSIDMGVMQINSLWLPVLEQKWNMPRGIIQDKLVNDACTNVSVASWILANHLRATHGNLIEAAGRYHSLTHKYSQEYSIKFEVALYKIKEGGGNNE
jgi:hypothetical protein